MVNNGNKYIFKKEDWQPAIDYNPLKISIRGDVASGDLLALLQGVFDRLARLENKVFPIKKHDKDAVRGFSSPHLMRMVPVDEETYNNYRDKLKKLLDKHDSILRFVEEDHITAHWQFRGVIYCTQVRSNATEFEYFISDRELYDNGKPI